MRIQGTLLSLILIFILGSCGKSGDNRQEETDGLTSTTGASGSRFPEKTLFSSWTSFSGSRPLLNLTGGRFNSSLTSAISLEVLVTCDCFIFIQGNESAGTMRFSNCFNRAGNFEDFDCKKLEGLVSYNKTPTLLRLNCFDRPICGSYR